MAKRRQIPNREFTVIIPWVTLVRQIVPLNYLTQQYQNVFLSCGDIMNVPETSSATFIGISAISLIASSRRQLKKQSTKRAANPT